MSIKITIPNSSSDVLTFGSGNTPTAAQIAGIDSGSSNGQLALYTTASGTSTERVRINASGNVGIGTSSPDGKLHVSDASTGTTLRVVNTSSSSGSRAIIRLVSATSTFGSALFQTNGTDASYTTSALNLYAFDSQPLVFGTSNAERARIASGGQFCVNTTNTNGAFNVSGNVYLFSQSAGAGTHFLKWNSGTGQVTYDSSSRLVKDNIVDSPYGLAEVMQLKSRKYLRIDDQRDEIGLIADEVQAVMPEFVPMSQKSIFTKNEEDTELVPSGVYYEKLSSVLVKAIQEQQAIITSLTDRITALENK